MYKKAVLSQGTPRDAAVNFDTYRNTAASCGFHCDSTAFVLKMGKFTVLDMSTYSLQIRYFIHIVCTINISDRSKF